MTIVDSFKARTAWGEWLTTIVWDHFVVLTFAHQPGPELARTLALRWIRRLEQRAQRVVGWFYALERSPGGRLHLHVLAAGTASVPPHAIAEAWSFGRADVSPYDRTKRGTYYVTKDIGFSVVDYDVAPPSAFRE